MKLNNLTPAAGSKGREKRIGRKTVQRSVLHNLQAVQHHVVQHFVFFQHNRVFHLAFLLAKFPTISVPRARKKVNRKRIVFA